VDFVPIAAMGDDVNEGGKAVLITTVPRGGVSLSAAVLNHKTLGLSDTCEELQCTALAKPL
jgi:hypothetical protein